MWNSSFEMIHVMPTSCLSPDNTSYSSGPDSPFQLDFDFGVFSPSDFGYHLVDQYQQVPSVELFDSNISSPTMFSPKSVDKNPENNWLETNHPTSSSQLQRSQGDPFSYKNSSLPTGRSLICSSQDSVMDPTVLAGPSRFYPMPSADQNQQVCHDVRHGNEMKPELGENALSVVEMNPVVSLAMEQVKREIESTSQFLNISTNPFEWSRRDVICWMDWTMAQYNIIPIRPLQDWVGDGQLMSQLSEAHFKDKIPVGGDVVFALLDVWKHSGTCQKMFEPFHNHSTSTQSVSVMQQNQTDFEASIDINTLLTSMDGTDGLSSYCGIENNSTQMMMSVQGQPKMDHFHVREVPSQSGDVTMENEDDVQSEPEQGSCSGDSSPTHTPTSPTRTSNNIHLWQFVKELLNDPQMHSGCIYWIDREKGIFKIVDSVRVAQMWGKRKNRPAMNYDKLSRSLRQYYKKGIMKKTERTQRLVYQFCSPYHL